ncbi:DUF6708 domain-containing protein, partial [Achromobacter sp. LC458]|uniref:DUF6708 domain-containing protein n=1 Tax=Achromobacter sp. LC458 TaxID=1120623 RepID=UPI00351B3250
MSRRATKMRGLMLFLALFPLVFLLFLVFNFGDLSSQWELGLAATAEMLAIYPFMAAMAYHCIRIDTAIPRDEPVRFNRLRRTVYVYSFEHVWWNPFAKWQVTTKSYDWADLRAEVWRQRG